MSGPPVDVLVAIPAHDEAETIGACLASVTASLAEARRQGRVARTRVAVALHRCRDETGSVVRAAVVDELMIMVEEAPMPVGHVRTRLIGAAAAYRDPLGVDTWVFSTDADTLVPPGWVSDMLAVGVREGADLVLGLAELGDWDVDAEARAGYRKIIDAGLTPTGHQHAYAANLAIRLQAFRQVGGFPGLAHGEEHGLARAVRSAGLRVSTPLVPRVLTSARMPGRAASGLGSLLDTLAHHPPRKDIS